MKRTLALLLAVMLLTLCGCSGDQPETQPVADPAVNTTAPTTQATEPQTQPATEDPTQPATEAPTEPKTYTNPLNGETLDAPFTNRLFAVSINNRKECLPHVGIVQADIYMEMFVNGSLVRGLALYSDLESVESVGSVRSTRMIFNDLASRFDAYLVHAGGSNPVMQNVRALRLGHINIDTNDSTDYSFRHTGRKAAGYDWEDILFVKGAGMVQHARDNGVTLSMTPDRNYGFNFTQDGTPAEGEDANVIDIHFTLNGGGSKTSTLEYNADQGGYNYYQYNQLMVDGHTGEVEVYENVMVLMVQTHMDPDGYHIAEFTNSGSGQGYFACGGKLIPILWHCAGEDAPLTYTTLDGQPLLLGQGRTYIGICGLKSTVDYK